MITEKQLKIEIEYFCKKFPELVTKNNLDFIGELIIMIYCYKISTPTVDEIMNKIR